MASQYGEHELILKHFAGRRGKFLDVGAHDGKIFSNTRCLYDNGWAGVLVEPSPSVFPYLMKNYEGADNIELVNAALGAESAVQEWWDNNGDCLGTFAKTNLAKFSALGHPFRKLWLPTITWSQLLAALPGPYDFLNIDVEGWNYEVLELAPLQSMGVDMVCIELDPKKLEPNMRHILATYGLTNQQVVIGNLLAWR